MIDNPYAAPQSSVELIERNRCWRESDSILHIAVGSDLPQRCVKCNGPLTATAKQKTYYWHASGWYLLIFFNLLIYAIVAFFVRKKIKLSPGLCDAHKKRRNMLVFGSLGAFFLSFVIGVVMAGGETSLISVAAFVGAFVALIVMLVSSRTLSPVEINDGGARFKGCGKAFLQSLSQQRSR